MVSIVNGPVSSPSAFKNVTDKNVTSDASTSGNPLAPSSSGTLVKAGLGPTAVSTAGLSGFLTDNFFNWYALDASDFRFTFGYALVMTKNEQYVNHIYFPLSPESISFSTPVATVLGKTLRGVIETHNGAPFRPITLAGTTGVWNPVPASGPPKSTSNSTLDYLFKNTIQAAQGLGSTASRLGSALSGSPQVFSGPLNYTNSELTTSAFSSPLGAGISGFNPGLSGAQVRSGFFFFHNLVRFLDFYVAAKAGRDGKDFRLTFHMYKDKMYYDVSLQDYSWRKGPGTLEYDYTIKMTAYRRRKDPAGGVVLPRKTTDTTSAATLSTMATIVSTIQAARNVLASVTAVIRGVSTDANDSFFTPLREIGLLAKDVAGVVVTLADMPTSIVQGAKQAFNTAASDVTQAGAAIRQAVQTAASNIFTAPAGGATPAAASVQQWQQLLATQSSDGMSSLAVRNATPNPYEAWFADPVTYFPIVNVVSVDQLTLPANVQTAVNNEINRIRQFTVTDVQRRRDSISSFSSKYAQAFGGGDATYNAVFGLPPPVPNTRHLTTEDVAVMSMMNEAIMAADQLVSALQNIPPTPDTDYQTYYANYALAAGIDFQLGQSKFLVPFPFGATIESLAVQYLGEASRWTEIAALNGLKAPYVDEVGFRVPLLVDAGEDSAYVGDRTDLYVGQIVSIGSSTVTQVRKQIAEIDQIEIGQFYVTFAPDNVSLAPYLASDGAYLMAYMPDTVNSQMLVAIPSQSPVNVPGQIRLTPGAQDVDYLGNIAQVDWLLATDGSLVVNGSGDVQLSAGMTNMIQAPVIRLNTPQGSMVWDQNYGNPLQPGTPVSQLDVPNLISNLSGQFAQDPRFVGLLAGQVTVSGPTAAMQILLGISGTDLNLPISTQLPVLALTNPTSTGIT